jgi:multiple sugar transport system substrate-binding protein
MVTRRQFLAATGAFSLPLVLGACSSGSSGGAGQPLDVIWWGADDRARITEAVFDLYEAKHAGSTVQGQFLPFGDYFNKLNTLSAAGAVPDVMQMNLPNLATYAEDGLLLDLESELTLDLGDYPAASLETGRIDGKLYGINFGYQYLTTTYNPALVDRSGLQVPADPADWNAWADFAQALSEALGEGIYGMSDNSAESNALAAWIQGRGKSLYTPDAGLGYDLSDIEAWYQYWADLRTRGAIAPGPQSQPYVSGGGAADDPLTTGLSVITFSPIVQFQGYQEVNSEPLALAACPTGPEGRGEVNPFFGWSVSASSENLQAVQDFLTVWFTDPAAFEILGLDRAVPASPTQLQEVAKSATGAVKTMLDFLEANPVEPASQPAPPAVGARITDVQKRAAEGLVVGAMSPQQAAAMYMEEAEAAVQDA